MNLKRYNSIDIETDGLDIHDKINWLGIHTWDGTEEDEGETIIIDCNTEQAKMHAYLAELQDKKYINVFHNGKFDTKMIKFHIESAMAISKNSQPVRPIASAKLI